MDAVTVLALELGVSLAVSTLILVRLQSLIRRVGNEVCDRSPGATEFWIAYTQLMMLISPLLIVSWFSRAGTFLLHVEQLKSSLGLVLTGQFIGLALVGRAVWRSMVKPPSPLGEGRAEGRPALKEAA